MNNQLELRVKYADRRRKGIFKNTLRVKIKEKSRHIA